MTAIRAVIFGLFGLCFGSFATVLVTRIPKRQSVARGRSACPVCGATIRARDNVPILSYLVLRGRCSTCGSRISPMYPLVEAATAGLFAGAALAFQDIVAAAVMAPFLGLLLALALIDVEHKILPNAIVYPATSLFAAGVAAVWLVTGRLSAIGGIIGFFAFGAALLAVALVSPGGMGMGDVKLAALIGLVLGSLGLRYVAVAAGLAVLGAGIGAILALIRGRSRKTALAFGPYLAAGAAAAVFWGRSIAAAYLTLR